MGVLRVLDRTGDSETPWTKETADAASDVFDGLVKRGFTCFRVTEGDTAGGELIRTFDADASEIIAVPRIVGG